MENGRAAFRRGRESFGSRMAKMTVGWWRADWISDGDDKLPPREEVEER